MSDVKQHLGEFLIKYRSLVSNTTLHVMGRRIRVILPPEKIGNIGYLPQNYKDLVFEYAIALKEEEKEPLDDPEDTEDN